MFGFFTPGYVKEARELLKNARKLLSYKKDIWAEATVVDFQAAINNLEKAIAARDEKGVKEESDRLEGMAGKYSPLPKDASIRENCEVLLVAIIIALGVRTYFLQPFTIPTGSMQPTLNGIIGHPATGQAPGMLSRVMDKVVNGRGYVEVKCEEDGEVTKIQETQRYRFFTYTEFLCGSKVYSVAMPSATLMNYFHVEVGTRFKKGEMMVQGYVDTGDHVFVDKMTYNFRLPQRGEVFVFNTKGIPTDESRNPKAESQFYIKRLAGLPGDQLRIDSPLLYQNGAKATAFGFQRVMAAVNGYSGYGQGPSFGYLSSPEKPYLIPEKKYFALGDNSYHSSDSRYWGTVPEKNIMGKALVVYWPFNSHWGLIK